VFPITIRGPNDRASRPGNRGDRARPTGRRRPGSLRHVRPHGRCGAPAASARKSRASAPVLVFARLQRSSRWISKRPQRSGAESPIPPKISRPAAVWCGPLPVTLIDALAMRLVGLQRQPELLAHHPARKPRTECTSQPVASMMALMVVGPPHRVRSRLWPRHRYSSAANLPLYQLRQSTGVPGMAYADRQYTPLQWPLFEPLHCRPRS
jgi:hypothetical protein